MKPVRIVSLGAGLLGLLAVGLSLLPIGFGMLGLLGIVADVSPAENRQIGLQFLAFGLPAFMVGTLLLLGGSFGFFWSGREKAIPGSPDTAPAPVPATPGRGGRDANGSSSPGSANRL